MKNIFKKSLSFILVSLLMFCSLYIKEIKAVQSDIQTGTICISANGTKAKYNAIKYEKDIYLPAKAYGIITRYTYFDGENDNLSYKLGKKIIIINKYTGYMQISCMNYVDVISKPIEYGGEFYLSASELLPWLNVGCYEQDGELYLISDAISIWEVMDKFTYDEYMFNLYNEYGDSVSSVSALSAMMVFDTFLNLRFDRLISAENTILPLDGNSLYDYKCYVEVLSELAIDDYLKSNAAKEVMKESIKINENIDKLEKVLGIDEKEIQKDMDDYFRSLGTDEDTVLFFYDLMEEWKFLRESVASYAKVSKYMDVFEVFKAYEITVKANDEYKNHLEWLSQTDTENKLFNSALNEASVKLNKEYGAMLTFYMNLSKAIFSNVPSGAIKAIANNSMNDTLSNALSKITIATDFIGSLSSYLAIAKVFYNSVFPVAKGYESMSKINVTEGIQDYSWNLAEDLCEKEITSDNLMHIRQSYIMALKASRLCYKAQQETFDPFGGKNILSYKFNQIDKKIAEIVCCADTQTNDSIDNKETFTDSLLKLFEKLVFSETSQEESEELTDDAININHVRRTFVAAGETYRKWIEPKVSEDIFVENVDSLGRTFKLVKEDITTISDLRVELKKHFTHSIINDIIEKNYIEIDGNLYFSSWPTGIEDTLYVTKDELLNKNGELVYRVHYAIVNYDGELHNDVYEMTIISENGNYIFEDGGIDFIRLSSEIDKLYIKEENKITNKEINNTAIQTAYKYLLGYLYNDGDEYCEYMLYDIDQDGTSELIYIKGTCMADLKVHFYTYSEGKVEELLANVGGHVSLYAKEFGEGLYLHFAHMGSEALYRLNKVGNEIIEELIFTRDGIPDSEEYSPPDDKYRLTTYQYNDYSGIEEFAVYNLN